MAKLANSLRNPSRVLGRLKSIVDARVVGRVMPRPRQGNIAMFHIGRSGSTVLADLLDQHPRIFWDQEIYRPCEERLISSGRAGASVRSGQAIDILQSRLASVGKEFYGFETKFFQIELTGVTLPAYVAQLRRVGITHFIILERKNYLRKVVSSVIRQAAQAHQARDQKSRLTRVSLDVDHTAVDRSCRPLLAYLQHWQENFKQLEQLLSGAPLLYLTYEADIAPDPRLGYRRICDFIGVEPHEVEVRFGKTNPFKLSEILLNFNEVEAALAGTPFEWMLAD